MFEMYSTLILIAGEDLCIGDYFAVGGDGKVYRTREGDNLYPLSGYAHADIKAGEFVKITMPTFFTDSDMWACGCGYAMPARLTACVKCGAKRKE